MFVGVSCGGEFWGLDGFRRVEELGFDGLFTGEHLLFHRPVWDAVSMCTAMACATERIAIGPAATIAPLRHPTLLAKEFTGVDRISDGRLILTLGVGGDNPKEFEAAGVPLERRGRRTQETLEILRRYFSGERFSYRGEIFQLERRLARSAARPGGAAADLGRRAARADPAPGGAARRRLPALHDHAGELRPACAAPCGSWPRPADGSCPASTPSPPTSTSVSTRTRRDARRRADEHLAWRYTSRASRATSPASTRSPAMPRRCAEGLRRFVEAGATHLVLSLVRRQGEDRRWRRSGRLPRESCHTCGPVDRMRPMAAGTFRLYPFRSAFTSARNGNVSQSPVPRSACAAMRLPARRAIRYSEALDQAVGEAGREAVAGADLVDHVLDA